MRVLGLSAFYHDSAAALVEDGRIVAAAPQTGSGGREEGSVLGGLGRIIGGETR